MAPSRTIAPSPRHLTSPATYTSESVGHGNTLNMAEYLDPGDSDLSENTPRAPFFSNAPARTDLGGAGKGKGADWDDPSKLYTPQNMNAHPPPVSLMVLSELEAASLVHLYVPNRRVLLM